VFIISKTFEFSSAHSVHSQRLNPDWAANTYPKCRRLPGHGHNYRLVVYLASEKLDGSQMVTDFGHLGWLKRFIDDCFDHKLILGIDDPAFSVLFEKLELLRGDFLLLPGKATVTLVTREYRVRNFTADRVPLEEISASRFLTFNNFSSPDGSPVADFYQRLIDGIALFEGSPTSENLARFFYYFVRENVRPLGVECLKVDIYETSTSCASYGER